MLQDRFSYKFKNSNKGVYTKGYNSQTHNTPTVVYSIGGDRALNFKRLIEKKNKLHDNPQFKEVCNQTNGSFVTINGLDKQYRNGIKYVHGGIKVHKQEFTIDFVWNKLNYESIYTRNNHMIPNYNIIPMDIGAAYGNFDNAALENELQLAHNAMELNTYYTI